MVYNLCVDYRGSSNGHPYAPPAPPTQWGHPPVGQHYYDPYVQSQQAGRYVCVCVCVAAPVEVFLAGSIPYQLESVQAYFNGMVLRHEHPTIWLSVTISFSTFIY